MVRHFLADGREVKSIEGMIVPRTGETAAVYHIVAEFAKNHKDASCQKKKGGTDQCIRNTAEHMQRF